MGMTDHQTPSGRLAPHRRTIPWQEIIEIAVGAATLAVSLFTIYVFLLVASHWPLVQVWFNG